MEDWRRDGGGMLPASSSFFTEERWWSGVVKLPAPVRRVESESAHEFVTAGRREISKLHQQRPQLPISGTKPPRLRRMEASAVDSVTAESAAALASPLADSATFDARLSASEAENAVLLERCEALLDECKAFHASALPEVKRGALASLGVRGGFLAALAGDAAPQEATPEARLAASLEQLGEETDDVPVWMAGLAAPLAASLGSALLQPMCEALRRSGLHREAYARRLDAELVAPLSSFVDGSLRGVAVARAAYARRCRDADVARDAQLRFGRSKDARARAHAASASAEAALARDAARAALSAAVTQAEGARRHAVLTSVSGALRAMQEFAVAVAADVEACQPALLAAAQFAEEAEAQARRRGEAQADLITAFLRARQAELGREVEEESEFGHSGRSQADSAVRQRMAGTLSETIGAPVFLTEGWLMMRGGVSFHKRYFVLDARGLLFYARGREMAVEACVLRRAAEQPAEQLEAPLVEAAVEEEETAADSEPDLDADAAALARAVGNVWSMGTSFLRGAVSVARSAAETAGELASAGAARVSAPASGCVQLLTCSIKLGPPEGDAGSNLPFVFRCLSPVPGASLTLQAESAAERAAWVEALQGAIAELLSGGGGTGGGGRALRTVPGNSTCADCGAAEPDWASLNLGVLLCQRCAGAHRRLGAGLSAVRSLTLDSDAWTPTVLALFATRGNTAANELWAGCSEALPSLSVEDGMEARLELVRAKYVDRMGLASRETAGLAEAAAAGDLDATLQLLAAGASPSGALEGAVCGGHLLVAQALLLWGAEAVGVELVPEECADAEALRGLLASAGKRQAEGRAARGGAAEAEVVATVQPAPAAEADPPLPVVVSQPAESAKAAAPPPPSAAEEDDDADQWLAD